MVQLAVLACLVAVCVAVAYGSGYHHPVNHYCGAYEKWGYKEKVCWCNRYTPQHAWKRSTEDVQKRSIYYGYRTRACCNRCFWDTAYKQRCICRWPYVRNKINNRCELKYCKRPYGYGYNTYPNNYRYGKNYYDHHHDSNYAYGKK